MGMDVIGKNAISDVGRYFRNSDSGWTPLAEYVLKVAPEIASKCTHWHSNDGDGLSKGDSRMLADVLQSEIDTGRTQAYARRRRSELEMMYGYCTFSVLNVQRFTGDPVEDSIALLPGALRVLA